MIERPTNKDIGKRVKYIAKHLAVECGTITSVNDFYVFVRYDGDNHSKATKHENLEWVNET